MLLLTDLPVELLQQIFRCVSSIDDVHHLARTCKTTYRAVQVERTYTDVMRSVIRNSLYHRFDIQLCGMTAMHRDMVQYLQTGGGPIRPTPLAPSWTIDPTSLNVWEMTLDYIIRLRPEQPSSVVEQLPDDYVHEVLARWQGLHELQDLWLDRQLRDQDFLVADDNRYRTRPNHFVRAYEKLKAAEEEFRDGGIPARAWRETESYTSLNDDYRGRFHAAVTYIWLLNEIRWVLTNFEFSATPDELRAPLLLLEGWRETLEGQTETPLLDELDRYSVFQFLYHHLLPLHGHALADQDSSTLPLTFPSQMDKDPIYCARFLQLFLVAGQTYLQPPDIIDLVIRSKLQRRPPYPELHFPKSTQCYLRPHHNSVRFHAGISLNNSGPYNATRLHQAITLRSIHILRLFERSTITQTARSPAPAYARRVPTGSLYCVNECLDEYLKQRVHSLYMRRGEGLLEVTDIFDKHWPIVRWMIWWWANSEDKARMKMERWREAPR